MNAYGNTNSKKVRNSGGLALLLIALLLVSCVGVAYAYSALTSEQEIDNNTITDEYIVLKTNSEDVLETIAFDTVTDGTNVTGYKVHTTESLTISGTPTPVLKISDPTWEVNVTKTNVSDSDSVTYGLTVTVTAFTPVAGLNYVMVLDDGDTYTVINSYHAIDANHDGWTFTGLSYATDYSVALYVYGQYSGAVAQSGFTNYDSTANPVVTGSVFKFVATAEPVA